MATSKKKPGGKAPQKPAGSPKGAVPARAPAPKGKKPASGALKGAEAAPDRAMSALEARRAAYRGAKRSNIKFEVQAEKGKEKQPLSGLQWVDPTTLKANSYNPNRVASIEMDLLKLSILEDGWTQPIVARSDGEIVDGFHRWTLGSKDKDVRSLTGGLVPVVRVSDARSKSDQMMSTIRHNRARGSHLVVKMADIVRSLKESGLTIEQIMSRLGMEFEEVDRLLDSSGMLGRGASDEFNKGWVPK